jgi:SAM-dependent methyltransferase
MSKLAEQEYARRIDPAHLYLKPWDDPRVLREFACVLDLFLARLPGGKVLDVGCGPGWTSLLLSRAGFQVLGVDISDRMIEIARERAARESADAEFAVADMEGMDLGRDDFDAVLYFDCLHHCPEYVSALRQACKHLRRGGWVVLMETTLLHRFSPHARQVTREFGLTEQGFTRGQLRRALAAAGFADVTFLHDPGPCYRGLGGFLKAGLRLWCDFLFYYPQAKNIVLARKP